MYFIFYPSPHNQVPISMAGKREARVAPCGSTLWQNLQTPCLGHLVPEIIHAQPVIQCRFHFVSPSVNKPVQNFDVPLFIYSVPNTICVSLRLLKSKCRDGIEVCKRLMVERARMEGVESFWAMIQI